MIKRDASTFKLLEVLSTSQLWKKKSVLNEGSCNVNYQLSPLNYFYKRNFSEDKSLGLSSKQVNNAYYVTSAA